MLNFHILLQKGPVEIKLKFNDVFKIIMTNFFLSASRTQSYVCGLHCLLKTNFLKFDSDISYTDLKISYICQEIAQLHINHQIFNSLSVQVVSKVQNFNSHC